MRDRIGHLISKIHSYIARQSLQWHFIVGVKQKMFYLTPSIWWFSGGEFKIFEMGWLIFAIRYKYKYIDTDVE